MSNVIDQLDPEYWLGELLACLHGDGGHYIEEFGMEQAAQDAIAAHYTRVTALDALGCERDKYRVALEQIARYWAQPARDIALAALAAAEKQKL